MTASLLAFSAQGDIYRCVGANGVVQYSDQPCSGVSTQVLKKGDSDSDQDEARLQQWLEELNKRPPQRPARSSSLPSSRSAPSRFSESGLLQPLPPLPQSRRDFSACSSQFFSCAGSNEQQMDRCIEQIPQCSSNQFSACCSAPYIDRYSLLRRSGASRQEAVRAALLGLDSERDNGE